MLLRGRGWGRDHHYRWYVGFIHTAVETSVRCTVGNRRRRPITYRLAAAQGGKELGRRGIELAGVVMGMVVGRGAVCIIVMLRAASSAATNYFVLHCD